MRLFTLAMFRTVGVYEYVGLSVRICWFECTNMLVGVYEFVGWSVRVCWLECTNMSVGVYE